MAPSLFPVADDICARHVCLPIYYGMTDDDVGDVVDALLTIVRDDAPGAARR